MNYKNLIKSIASTIIIGFLLITNYLSLTNGFKLEAEVFSLKTEVIRINTIVELNQTAKDELFTSYAKIDSLTAELKTKSSSVKTKVVHANNGLPIGMIKKNDLYIFSLRLFQKQYAKYNQSAILFNGKLFDKLTLAGVDENTDVLVKRHNLDELWLYEY